MCFPALFLYICHQYYQMYTSYETSSLICVVVCVGTAFVQFHPDNHFRPAFACPGEPAGTGEDGGRGQQYAFRAGAET